VVVPVVVELPEVVDSVVPEDLVVLEVSDIVVTDIVVLEIVVMDTVVTDVVVMDIVLPVTDVVLVVPVELCVSVTPSPKNTFPY
jgi:hypothetical protein